MDFNKFFSDLEFQKIPDDFFIGHYGFTVDGIREKLKDFENEDSALNYLTNLRHNLNQITSEIEPYSFLKFYDFKPIQCIDPSNINSDKKSDETETENENPYSIAHKEYNEYLTKIDLNTISNPITRIILEDAKAQRSYTDVLSLLSEFGHFIYWLEDIIRKIFIVKSTSTVNGKLVHTENVSKDKLPSLANFHPDLPNDIDSINIVIDTLIESNTKKQKSIIITKVLNLYEEKYKAIEIFKDKSFFLALIYEYINHRQKEWTQKQFIKYAENR